MPSGKYVELFMRGYIARSACYRGLGEQRWAWSFEFLLDAAHVCVGHCAAGFKHTHQIIRRRIDEFQVPQQILRPANSDAAVVFLGLLFATTAKFVHHILPGAFEHFWVMRRHLHFGHGEIQHGTSHGFVLRMHHSTRFPAVLGFKALLPSRRAILDIIDAVAFEQIKPLFHVCLS
jgi:hypothetical protein